jgi:hypothetical protein
VFTQTWKETKSHVVKSAWAMLGLIEEPNMKWSSYMAYQLVFINHYQVVHTLIMQFIFIHKLRIIFMLANMYVPKS